MSESTSYFGSLSGLRACVTGSSSGIGLAIAREFARAGADVLLHGCRSAETLDRLSREIHHEFGVRTAFLIADLREPEILRSFAESAWNTWDGLHVWVNNAGVDLLTGDAKDWDFATKLQALLEMDVRSSVLLSRQIGERMQVAGQGVILNIGWDQADRGMEGFSGELFAAAKNAIMGFTRSLAVSLAPQVRVNCIAPGWIRTAWGEQASSPWQERVVQETPLKRWGTPEDIAFLARFLASPQASYLTGQVINANGGAVR